MKSEDLIKTMVVIAIILAIVAIGIALFVQPQAPAGITYDPAKQPSLLPLKSLTAATDDVSGIIMDYQKINTTSTPYVGQLVTLSGATWIPADPSSTLNGKLGLVAKAPATNISTDGQILIMGVLRNSSWSMTQGDVQYANATTPGSFGTVKPNGSAVIQSIGWAYGTNVIFFNPAINVTANGL